MGGDEASLDLTETVQERLDTKLTEIKLENVSLPRDVIATEAKTVISDLITQIRSEV